MIHQNIQIPGMYIGDHAPCPYCTLSVFNTGHHRRAARTVLFRRGVWRSNITKNILRRAPQGLVFLQREIRQGKKEKETGQRAEASCQTCHQDRAEAGGKTTCETGLLRARTSLRRMAKSQPAKVPEQGT